MDRSPGCCLSPSVDRDFTPNDIEVATTLTRLKYLIPLYDSRNCGFITPLWASKRSRSAYVSAVPPSSTCLQPDRLRTESGIIGTCPVVFGGGNLRNISPDSPLLLKDSPLTSGMQGSSGIATEPHPEKMTTKKRGCKVVVDDFAGVKISKKNPKKEKMETRKVERERREPEELPVPVDVSLTSSGQRSVSQLTSDHSSVRYPLPNGGASARLGLLPRASRPQLLFDLNILPPDCMGIKWPLRDVDGEPGPPPYAVAAADDGITKAEKAKAARQKRIAIRRDQISKAKGSSSKAHLAWRH